MNVFTEWSRRHKEILDRYDMIDHLERDHGLPPMIWDDLSDADILDEHDAQHE